MSFSDILALVEILVTILFGYYITHWVSVRDTRTRSVKDLYLNQLTSIKKNVDTFFKDLFEGKMKGRTIADWYGHQQNSLTCFDEGLRMALPIRKEKLEDVVNRIHEEITGSNFYNENFKKKKYELTKDEQVRMLDLKNRVDKSFNEYVVQINNSRQYYFWEVLKQNYKFDVEFFKASGKKYPNWNSIVIRSLKLLPYVLVLGFVLFISYSVFHSYRSGLGEKQARQDSYETGINKMINVADSLNGSLDRISTGIDNMVKEDSALIMEIKKGLVVDRQLLRGVISSKNSQGNR